MPPNTGDDRPLLRRRHLTRAERDEVNAAIAERVREIGETPHRSLPPGWTPESGGYPFPRNRWLFPSVAYPRAGQHAWDFRKAMATHRPDATLLRLVTLRFGAAKPAAGDLVH